MSHIEQTPTIQPPLVTRREAIVGGTVVAVAVFIAKKLGPFFNDFQKRSEGPQMPPIEVGPKDFYDPRTEQLTLPNILTINGQPINMPELIPYWDATPEVQPNNPPTHRCREAVVNDFLDSYIEAISGANRTQTVANAPFHILMPGQDFGTHSIVIGELTHFHGNKYYYTDSGRTPDNVYQGAINSVISIRDHLQNLGLPQPMLYAIELYNQMIYGASIEPRDIFNQEVDEIMEEAKDHYLGQLSSSDSANPKHMLLTCTPSPDDAKEAHTSGREMFDKLKTRLKEGSIDDPNNVITFEDNNRLIILNPNGNSLQLVLPQSNPQIRSFITPEITEFGIITDQVHSGQETGAIVSNLLNNTAQKASQDDECLGDYSLRLWTAYAPTWPSVLVATAAKSVARGNLAPKEIHIRIRNIFNIWLDTVAGSDIFHKINSQLHNRFTDATQLLLSIDVNAFAPAGLIKGPGTANTFGGTGSGGNTLYGFGLNEAIFMSRTLEPNTRVTPRSRREFFKEILNPSL